MWNKERVITAAILLGATAIMMFPLVMNWSGRTIPMVQDLGFAHATWAPLHAWIAALLFAGAYIAYTFRVLPFVREQQHEISFFKLIGVAAAFASGIMEEVVFRRWLMDTALSYGIGSVGQIFLSAVIFGLFHLAWHAFSADRRFSLYGAVSTVVAGAALAVIYLLGGRNLGPCIAAHMLINMVVEPWLVLAAVSGSSPKHSSS
ncbi:CPBP family intramembrane metalloprotease [Altererythrobacter sp.]|nr:CPBP family intramembrane metalloprotease [Altererythrobacter sp.]